MKGTVALIIILNKGIKTNLRGFYMNVYHRILTVYHFFAFH